MEVFQVVRLGGRRLYRLGIALLGAIAMLHSGPILLTAGSMALSLLVYGAAFGWQFAAGLVLLLFIHELGHLLALAVVGLKSGGMWFVPFLGAVISVKQAPTNVKTAANIAVAGPAAGAISALFCLACYFWTDQILWLVLCYTACLLNLLNLIPCAPLDGEKAAGAIHPKLWWGGSLVLLALIWQTANFILLIIFAFSLIRLWRETSEESYYRLRMGQKVTVACWYFGLLFLLGGLTWYTWLLLK